MRTRLSRSTSTASNSFPASTFASWTRQQGFAARAATAAPGQDFSRTPVHSGEYSPIANLPHAQMLEPALPGSQEKPRESVAGTVSRAANESHAPLAASRSSQGPNATELMQRAAAENSQAIDPPLHSFLGHHLGHDFSQVRVHSGAASASAAERIGARAYTLGNHIHLGEEAHSLPRNEYDKLLTHEAVHTVQQGGRTAAPHSQLTLSQPSDPAEREASGIADSLASPDAQRTPSRSLALRDQVRASAASERITRAVSPQLQRDLTGKKSVKDGDFDLNLKTESHPGASSGMSGTIKFKPSEAAPDSANIRLLQTVRNENLSTNKEYEWTGDEANRNSMMTAADPTKGVEKGRFVDHSAAMATPRTAKADASVSPYYRDYWPNADKSQDGSKKGKTSQDASLWDFPSSAGNRRFSFETAVKGADTGYIYATLTWGFTISDASKGKVELEYAEAHRGPSATFAAAVKAFDEFYKNPGASTAPQK